MAADDRSPVDGSVVIEIRGETEEFTRAMEQAAASASETGTAAGAALTRQLAAGVRSALPELAGLPEELAAPLVDGLAAREAAMREAGRQLVRGLWAGIAAEEGWLSGMVRDFAAGVVSEMKGAFQIASPSRIMRDEVGVMLAAGVAEGIESGAGLASTAMDRLRAAVEGEAIRVSTGLTVDNPARVTERADRAARASQASQMSQADSPPADSGRTVNSGRDIVLQVNGREFARATLEDFRAVEHAVPRIEDD